MKVVPIYNAHRTELGDWCGWSLEMCHPDETACPSNCPSSQVIDALDNEEAS